jgi:NAD(P)-dependent dehydrogenase (short-subunit alcohol dehydrogenase family)
MALLADRVVLVSGGTPGVGAGIVRAAVREGAHVAFTGRRPDAGDQLVAEVGSQVASASFDSQTAVNLRAPFFTMQAAVADMVGRQPYVSSCL